MDTKTLFLLISAFLCLLNLTFYVISGYKTKINLIASVACLIWMLLIIGID